VVQTYWSQMWKLPNAKEEIVLFKIQTICNHFVVSIQVNMCQLVLTSIYTRFYSANKLYCIITLTTISLFGFVKNVRVLFSTLSTYHITKRTLFEINNTDKSINLSNFTFNLLSFLFRMGVYGWMFLLVPAYRVVPDKQPLNGCCCSILTTHTASCQKDILQRNVLHEWINVSDKNAAHKRRGTCISQRTLSE